jgi:hypothetical protein
MAKEATLMLKNLKSHNRTEGKLVALLVMPGATLADLNAVAEWSIPYELANLKLLAKRRLRSLEHDGNPDLAARRYWLVKVDAIPYRG